MSPIFMVILALGVFLEEAASAPKNKIIFHRSQRKNHQYQFEFEAEDGSRRQEVGTFVYRENKSEPVLHVKGTYSYIDGEGRKFVVNYEADDQGTRQDGDVVPPIENRQLATQRPHNG